MTALPLGGSKFKLDGFVKSPNFSFFVIPAGVYPELDPWPGMVNR